MGSDQRIFQQGLPSYGADTSSRMVHVIDDDRVFRTSMQRMLDLRGFATAGYESVGEFLLAHGGEVIGCILLDIALPGPSGLDLLRAFVERGSCTPVVFVTARDEVVTSVEAMKCGAFDYVVKPVSIERVVHIVQKALEVDVALRAKRRGLSDLRARFEQLTQVERAVFFGIVGNRLNKQIAAELGACERTIKTRRARMMEKLNVAGVPDLVRMAAALEAVGYTAERFGLTKAPAQAQAHGMSR